MQIIDMGEGGLNVHLDDEDIKNLTTGFRILKHNSWGLLENKPVEETLRFLEWILVEATGESIQ